MPIIVQHPAQTLSEKEFHELDYNIMKLSFGIHNELGRFYDENIYQAELYRRCLNEKIPATQEFEAKLIYEDYVKSLYIDLFINNSTVYELKACKALVEPNRIQTLNYLFATNTHHGKLINFRPFSVEHEFVSTRLDSRRRIQFTIHDELWCRSEPANQLRTVFINLLSDWGAFFDTDIYMKALLHLFGGSDQILRAVPIYSGGQFIGHQKMPHLSETEIFCLTSVVKNPSKYQTHLLRLLQHTKLECIHWINLQHTEIHFSSLSRKSFCP
ncbi:MAG: GxxExxY protein [Pontiellaceae bacterium]|nr:GxxExxY protein [Pontiellaceae bacterium]